MLANLFAWCRLSWVRRSTYFGLAALLGVAACGQLEQRERELTFRIQPGEASWYGGLPSGVREFNIAVAAQGEAHINAWWWPAADRDAPALLYLHGSRWNLTGQLFRIRQLHDFGFSVLAIDYRGFGRSSAGLPSEETVYEDARVAWERLSLLQLNPAKRFIYGHSLGGAVAIDLAAHLSKTPIQAPSAGGLIVESSFTSLADIARSLTYPWLPAQLLLSQKFDSVDKIAKVQMPVLLVHGTGDRYVPSRFSQALFDAAPTPKKLLLIEGASHNNSIRLGSEEYREALHELFGVGPNKTAPKAAS